MDKEIEVAFNVDDQDNVVSVKDGWSVDEMKRAFKRLCLEEELLAKKKVKLLYQCSSFSQPNSTEKQN